MTPVERIVLAGARGGQGTTVVATALAVLAAGHRPTALVARRPGDVCSLAGLAEATGPLPLGPGLELAPDDGDAEVGVHDLGHLGEISGGGDPARGLRLLVVRGPCYLALRAAVESSWSPDGVILVSEAGRALTPADVDDVLGAPVVARVPAQPALARLGDAGLLVAQMHRLDAFAELARLVRRRAGGGAGGLTGGRCGRAP